MKSQGFGLSSSDEDQKRQLTNAQLRMFGAVCIALIVVAGLLAVLGPPSRAVRASTFGGTVALNNNPPVLFDLGSNTPTLALTQMSLHAGPESSTNVEVYPQADGTTLVLNPSTSESGGNYNYLAQSNLLVQTTPAGGVPLPPPGFRLSSIFAVPAETYSFIVRSSSSNQSRSVVDTVDEATAAGGQGHSTTVRPLGAVDIPAAVSDALGQTAVADGDLWSLGSSSGSRELWVISPSAGPPHLKRQQIDTTVSTVASLSSSSGSTALAEPGKILLFSPHGVTPQVFDFSEPTSASAIVPVRQTANEVLFAYDEGGRWVLRGVSVSSPHLLNPSTLAFPTSPKSLLLIQNEDGDIYGTAEVTGAPNPPLVRINPVTGALLPLSGTKFYPDTPGANTPMSSTADVISAGPRVVINNPAARSGVVISTEMHPTPIAATFDKGSAAPTDPSSKGGGLGIAKKNPVKNPNKLKNVTPPPPSLTLSQQCEEATAPTGSIQIGTPVIGATEVNLSWSFTPHSTSLPCYPGSYEVSADGVSTVVTKTMNQTMTNLSPNASYTFTVTGLYTATKSVHVSITVQTLSTSPDSPTGVSATPADQTTSGAAAMVSWSAPGSLGGTSFIQYTVSSVPSGGTCTTSSVTATSCTVQGLTNGDSYTFKVVTVTQKGTSEPSVSVNSVVPSGVPQRMATPSATSNQPGQTTVSWPAISPNGGCAAAGLTTQPCDGGSPITSYQVTEYSPADPGGTPVTCPASGPTTTQCSITGLTNGTAYTFAVSAKNVNGSSAPSATSAPATPATAPDPPSLAVKCEDTTCANPGEVVLTATVANDGGAPITSYAISGGGTSSCSVANDVGSCTVSGLTLGTPYTFTATATSGGGTSGTGPQSATATPTAPPDQPASVTATYDSTSKSVAVSWTPGSSDGGSAVVGFEVVITTNSSGQCPATLKSDPANGLYEQTSPTTYSIPPVTLSTGTYSVSVCTYNALGPSTPAQASSNPITAADHRRPPIPGLFAFEVGPPARELRQSSASLPTTWITTVEVTRPQRLRVIPTRSHHRSGPEDPTGRATQAFDMATLA